MNLKSIDYKKDNEVANIIKINEPQFGMTLEILVEMEEALIDANNDKDISVIIISAGGEGFHMGAVVFGEVGNADWNLSPVEFRDISKVAHRLFRYIETMEKPVIGVAKGGA
ncbi:MAG: hypothetical protein QGI18_01400, partial [Candidatus Marinimicrobia bacterium]|nr:hypothetical protein [Candidatus Neomarinimicrobiota bacterium]